MAAPPEDGEQRFEILERLGAGGMGEVFRARDRKLNRYVALKFLPEAASDSARDRFEREAQAVAALNHPNICTLHETGESDGRPFLVLELLEGESLRQRLGRGPVAADVLQEAALELAEALDVAHRRGILHRDLKPDNIWLSAGGHVKVLDFGLARMQEADAAEAATVGGEGAGLTTPGLALGTVPYMAPEQARGEALDARSDIFSLGAVLYEMAAGKPAFARRSAAETLSAILTAQPPPLETARPELPAKLDEIIARCLEKDPDLRFQSAADLRGELKRLKRASSSESAAAVSRSSAVHAAAAAQPGRKPWLLPVVALVVLAVAGAAWWRWGRAGAATPRALTFRQLTFSGNVVDGVISPDGKFLAHVDNGPQGTSLHLLSVANGSDVEVVPPGPGCCSSPSFSPDGSQIHYLQARVLKAIPVLGGAARTIVADACSGAGFSPDGSRIAYLVAENNGAIALMLANPDGSGTRLLHVSPAGSGYASQCWDSPGQPTHSPAWSPDGNWIAINLSSQKQTAAIETVSTADGSVRDLASGEYPQAADASWVSNHELVFTSSIPASAPSELWSLTFPEGKLTRLTNDLQGYSGVSVASGGELALTHSTPMASIWVQARAGGAFQQLPGGGADLDGARGLSWTAAGALVSVRVLGGQAELWTEAADGSGAHPVWAGTTPVGLNLSSAAPNGQIVFGAQAGTNNIFRINADGTGLVPLLQLESGDQALYPNLALGGRDVAYVKA